MSPKTWAQLEGELSETFRKWRLVEPTIENPLPRRSKTKRYQSKDERTVTVRFSFTRRPVVLSVSRWDTATQNLEVIVRALETIRLTETRKLSELVVLLYRQMYPAPAAAPPPPPPPPPRNNPKIPEHYQVLHVSADAPLAVCEAAYRALARTAHPDAGGSTATMQRLNAAIERIRKEKV